MTEIRGLGRAIFAAVFLAIGSVLNIIYGIAAISRSHVFTLNASYVFADLRSWGWVTLAIGVLEGLAALSLFAGGAFGRWFGIFAGSLAAIAALLSLPAYPFWGIAVFALSIWIVHGLIVYGASLHEMTEGPRAGTTAEPRERAGTRT